MYQVLFFSLIAVLGCAITTVGIARGSLRPVPRILLTLVFALLTVGAVFWCIGTISALRENDANPTVETMAARLRACTAQPDRAAILDALKAAGFPAEITPRPYSATSDSVYLPPWAVAQSASSISFVTDRVRSDTATTITSDRLDVVFLFDSQGRLLTWSYRPFSIGP